MCKQDVKIVVEVERNETRETKAYGSKSGHSLWGSKVERLQDVRDVDYSGDTVRSGP
jgi:hypothetical protein